MSEERKRLAFLNGLLANCKVTKYALAEMMGVSKQNIFTYFKRDDMKLSYAMEIADRLGYTLSFTLDSGELDKASNVMIELGKLVGANGLNRLAFLNLALGMNGVSKSEVAEKLGLQYTGVQRWFKVDDIAISYIFAIADAFGWKVKIRADLKKEVQPDSIELE